MDSLAMNIAPNKPKSRETKRFREATEARVFFRQNANGTIEDARGDLREQFPRLRSGIRGQKLTDLTLATSRSKVLKALIDALEDGFSEQDLRLGVMAKARQARLRVKALPGGGFVSELVPLVPLQGKTEQPKATLASAATDQLANVSHEIRTPLNAVIGFADALRQESFGPLGDHRYRDYAKLIQESGQHVLSLVNDLLDLSKAEADKIELTPTDVNVRELVDSCVSMIAMEAENAGLDIRVVTASNVGTIQADAKVLRQVIINLLSNALKFTDRGRITVRTRLLDGRLVIAVEDTGVGMSADDLDRIGERFYQARSAGVRGARGTGLGLALCQALAKAHGGRLDINSRPGEGTVATLTVPVKAVGSRPASPTYGFARAKGGADWLDAERHLKRSA